MEIRVRFERLLAHDRWANGESAAKPQATRSDNGNVIAAYGTIG